jgi:RNA polymerase sigma-70 factor (ECF subfamily)
MVESLVARSNSARREPAFDLETVYRREFDFVWRNLRRLGVSAGALDDATQKVFLIVHRRLAELDVDARLRGWLFQIVRRVAHDERRATLSRRTDDVEIDPVGNDRDRPDVALDLKDAARLLHEILAEMDESRRDTFILSDLEGCTGPEIAEATSTNVNTVYARLRAAREEVEAGLLRRQTQQEATWNP